jgi:hypothetical protein
LIGLPSRFVRERSDESTPRICTCPLSRLEMGASLVLHMMMICHTCLPAPRGTRVSGSGTPSPGSSPADSAIRTAPYETHSVLRDFRAASETGRATSLARRVRHETRAFCHGDKGARRADPWRSLPGTAVGGGRSARDCPCPGAPRQKRAWRSFGRKGPETAGTFCSRARPSESREAEGGCAALPGSRHRRTSTFFVRPAVITWCRSPRGEFISSSCT